MAHAFNVMILLAILLFVEQGAKMCINIEDMHLQLMSLSL